MVNLDLSPSALSLSAVLLLCGYITHLCTTTPNPNPTNATAYNKDRIAKYHNLTSDARIRAAVIGLFYFYLVSLILLPDSKDRSYFCLHPSLLNPDLFRWSTYTAAFIAAVSIAGPIRLLAYAHLGKNFTFRLAKPDQLVTTGVYKYAQHPSYTTLLTMGSASIFFAMQSGGVLACVLPAWYLKLPFIGVLAPLAMSISWAFALWARVKDEETMMKETFGKEWEEYHARTKRFLPGVI